MNAVKSWAFPPGVPMSVAFALFRQVFASQIEPVAEPHSLMFAVHNDLDVASPRVPTSAMSSLVDAGGDTVGCGIHTYNEVHATAEHICV